MNIATIIMTFLYSFCFLILCLYSSTKSVLQYYIFYISTWEKI